MARTVFVNPTRRRRRRSKAKANPRRRRRRNAMMPALPNPRRRRHRRSRRRNAGIAPFVSNPLIMSNPRRRRRRHSNPLVNAFTVKNVLTKGVTYAGGAAIAVTTNVVALNRINNFWYRNAARLGSAIAGGALLKGELGAATAGAMLYPLMQEMAAKVLGTGAGVSATEADMDVLAADLEDVMDELDESDLSDDDDWEDDDDILGVN